MSEPHLLPPFARAGSTPVCSVQTATCVCECRITSANARAHVYMREEVHAIACGQRVHAQMCVVWDVCVSASSHLDCGGATRSYSAEKGALQALAAMVYHHIQNLHELIDFEFSRA